MQKRQGREREKEIEKAIKLGSLNDKTKLLLGISHVFQICFKQMTGHKASETKMDKSERKNPT